MIDNPQNPALRALLKAAKEDGPSAAANTRIWVGVAGASAAGGAAPLGSASPSVAAGGSGKLMALGALFGSAATVGLAMVMIRIVPAAISPAADAESQMAARSTELIAPAFVPLSEPGPVRASSATSVPAGGTAAPPPLARASLGGAKAIVSVPEDGLLRESMLVAEARSALVRGDAAKALQTIRSTQRLALRALEPEELSIESRALRALSREDEAMAVDLRLKARFPDHALAR